MLRTSSRFTRSGDVDSTRVGPKGCERYWDCRRRRPVLGGYWSTGTTSPVIHSTMTLSIATDSNVTAPAATARRVRDIATATGYTVDSVHVNDER